MKIIENESGHNIFYEVDDLSTFGSDLTLDDFVKLPNKKVSFINEEYDLFIVELDKNEFFYSYKDSPILILKSKNKLFEVNWDGAFHNVMDLSIDDYDTEMLDKIRNTGVVEFTTQF